MLWNLKRDKHGGSYLIKFVLFESYRAVGPRAFYQGPNLSSSSKRALPIPSCTVWRHYAFKWGGGGYNYRETSPAFNQIISKSPIWPFTELLKDFRKIWEPTQFKHNDYNSEEDKERCWWWPLLSLMDVLEKSLKFVTNVLISDRTPIKCYIFQEVRNMSTYQHWQHQWLRHFDPFLFLVLAAELSNYQRGQMHW